MKKLYSLNADDEECFELDYFVEMLKEDNHRNSLDLFVWEPRFGTGTFWCAFEGEGFESSEGVCGLECNGYKPRNGISGRCRSHKAPHHPTSQTFRIEK